METGRKERRKNNKGSVGRIMLDLIMKLLGYEKKILTK